MIREAERQRPTDVADRVRYMVHDFFSEQPIRGADVYFFRAIFHNWSDGYTVRILRRLVPALKPGARIIIQEQVISKPEKVPKPREAALRTGVMNMHVLFNSADRELSEWASLFHEADPNFDFKGGRQPPGSSMWILEAEWKGTQEGQ